MMLSGASQDVTLDDNFSYRASTHPRRVQPTRNREGAVDLFYAEAVDIRHLDGWTQHRTDLAERALAPNAFAEPAVVRALNETTRTPIVCILTWQSTSGNLRAKLVGAWPLAVRRPIPWLPLLALLSPLHHLCYLGTPVVDRSCAREVLECMVRRMSEDRSLPAIAFFGDLNGSCLEALEHALRACGLSRVITHQRSRAKLDTPLQGKEYLAKTVSGQRLKKLRQRRRRLANEGEILETVHRSASEVTEAFEEFLALEAAGWKGQKSQRGLAIARDASTTSFARAMVRGLADDGAISIHALRVAGRPAAMQIILRSGAGAFTWRTAYDERLHRCSPGLLIIENCTHALLADRGIRSTDSCNVTDEGYMADFWNERVDIFDVCVNLRTTGSARFWLFLSSLKLSGQVLATARRVYRMVQRLRPEMRNAGGAP